MEDLLSAGSIQAGRFRVVPRPTSLRAIVDDALEEIDLTLKERDQRPLVEIRADIDTVLADHRYIRQVLSNLLTNASKYGPQGGTIRVSAEAIDDGARVAVADEGPGIPAEQQRGLFERYYRLRPGGADEPGIGLGLAIAKGIVEAHGGRIGVDSGPGAGTLVWFTLRAASATPPA